MKDLFSNYNISAPTVCFRKELFKKYVPFEDFIKNKFPIERLAHNGNNVKIL